VIDNGSSTDVVEYLKHSRVTHRRLKVIFNADDLGFARAVNIGLAAMDRSDVVVMLNHDTIVTPGWLSRLVGHARRDPTVGMVGAITGWASDEGRFTTGYHSVNDLDVFAERQASAHSGQAHAMPTLNMFCVALRRDVIDHIGPLDESFGQGFFEDVDYAMRLHHAGYRIMRAEDVVVHYWQVGQSTASSSADQLFESNRKRFEQKWGQRWDQLPQGTPLLNPANSQRKK
jgi:GT2 family glycosyltransferase